jgi:hypothetical protein
MGGHILGMVLYAYIVFRKIEFLQDAIAFPVFLIEEREDWPQLGTISRLYFCKLFRKEGGVPNSKPTDTKGRTLGQPPVRLDRSLSPVFSCIHQPGKKTVF